MKKYKYPKESNSFEEKEIDSKESKTNKQKKLEKPKKKYKIKKEKSKAWKRRVLPQVRSGVLWV